MCGIAGVIGRWPGLDYTRFRDRVYSALAHRGPNGRGAVALGNESLVPCADGPVPDDAAGLLIHLRLSILDVGESGHQPMLSRRRRSVICYNGEVYNYLELRAELGETADSLRSSGDTAVLLAAMERDGEAALQRLEGMFAFAWLDIDSGRFVLARDALGIKPLFVARCATAIAFSSEIEPLLHLPGVSRRCNVEEAVQCLRFGLPEPSARSVFADIDQLQAGEVLTGALGAPQRARAQTWYTLPAAPSFSGTVDDAVDAFRAEFLRSVDLHLRSDRTVGTALSGGVDSSAVVAAMRHLRGPSLDLHTVSFIASTERLSERKWASLVADAVRSQATMVPSSETDLASDIDDYIRSQGEPVGGTSAYAQYCVYRAAAATGLTVMLDGQGPDEMLAGYDFYVATRLRELVHAGEVGPAAALLRSESIAARPGRGRLVMQSLRGKPAATAGTEVFRQAIGRASIAPWVWRSAKNPSVRAHLQSYRAPGFAGLHAHLRHSTGKGLVNLFRLADRNAMRFSIENRVPFSTAKLANLALSFPASFHFGPSGESKYVLRRAARGLVPDAILDRRDKIGFANDDADNLLKCDGWVDEAVRASASCPFVERDGLALAWREWKEGRRQTTAWLWSTLVFVRWWTLFAVSE